VEFAGTVTSNSNNGGNFSCPRREPFPISAEIIGGASNTDQSSVALAFFSYSGRHFSVAVRNLTPQTVPFVVGAICGG
jgi:hypothetical protein